MKTQTVLIVDDHPVVRLAIQVSLQQNGIQVVGEADNGVDALNLVQTLTPDVVILDIGIPKLDGFTVISRIKAMDIGCEVLVLTSQTADAICHRCMQLGSRGFINKEEDIGKLVDGVKAVAAGYNFFPTLTNDSVKISDHISEIQQFNKLTDREVVVLQHLVKGMSNKEIGEKIFLSNKTVSTYKMRLFQKLGVTSTVQLSEFAKRNNLDN